MLLPWKPRQLVLSGTRDKVFWNCFSFYFELRDNIRFVRWTSLLWRRVFFDLKNKYMKKTKQKTWMNTGGVQWCLIPDWEEHSTPTALSDSLSLSSTVFTQTLEDERTSTPMHGHPHHAGLSPLTGTSSWLNPDSAARVIPVFTRKPSNRSLHTAPRHPSRTTLFCRPA